MQSQERINSESYYGNYLIILILPPGELREHHLGEVRPKKFEKLSQKTK